MNIINNITSIPGKFTIPPFAGIVVKYVGKFIPSADNMLVK